MAGPDQRPSQPMPDVSGARAGLPITAAETSAKAREMLGKSISYGLIVSIADHAGIRPLQPTERDTLQRRFSQVPPSETPASGTPEHKQSTDASEVFGSAVVATVGRYRSVLEGNGGLTVVKNVLYVAGDAEQRGNRDVLNTLAEQVWDGAPQDEIDALANEQPINYRNGVPNTDPLSESIFTSAMEKPGLCVSCTTTDAREMEVFARSLTQR